MYVFPGSVSVRTVSSCSDVHCPAAWLFRVKLCSEDSKCDIFVRMELCVCRYYLFMYVLCRYYGCMCVYCVYVRMYYISVRMYMYVCIVCM